MITITRIIGKKATTNHIKNEDIALIITRNGSDFKAPLGPSIKSATINKNINISNFEYIFTTYGPISSIFIGLWTKKINRNIKWIADFSIHQPGTDGALNLLEDFLQRVAGGDYRGQTGVVPVVDDLVQLFPRPGGC